MAQAAGFQDIYLDALQARERRPLETDALAAEIEALWTSALASAPALAGLRSDFIRHLAHHAHEGRPPSRAYAADLGLAFACARGVPSAFRQLEPLLTSTVARAVARVDRSPAFADTVAQELRTRLLVGDSPKIAEYAGRGSLTGWLKTAALRCALNLRRGPAERKHDSLASGLRAAGAEPDVALLCARYQGDFEEALRAALGRLPTRDRALLALNVRGGMSCDKIAALYRIGRSTAKRWLAGARDALADETKRELRARLGLTSSEFESVAAAVCSAIDVSILGLLGDAGA